MSASPECFDEAAAFRAARGELDPELRQTLERHAAGCAACAARLAGAKDSAAVTDGAPEVPTRGDRPAPRPPAAPAPSLVSGAQLGRFIVLEKLGEGGMGRVVRAYDPQLGRHVAIKLLRSDVGGEARELAQARLLREAQAMARARHPNLVTVFEVGTSGDQVFLAMELVEGESLESWLRKERPWREILAVFLDAARGLAAAHAANLVHRDFKPANVLIGPDRRAQVTDFGIAHVQEGTAPTAPDLGSEYDTGASTERLTRAGNVVGTPRYMSPQQHAGEPLDGRSDQFSFCVALYEALYRQLPFEGKKVESRLERVEKGEVRPPPPRSRVPNWLFAALRRGLAFDPAGRFASMDALVAHVEAGLSRRRRRRLGAGVAVAALGLAAAVGLSVRLRPTPCAFGAEVLGSAWGPARADAIQKAFARSGQPESEVLFRTTREALDRYAQAWISMRRDACLETRVRQTQSEAVLQLRMLCLDRRRATLDALGRLLALGQRPVLARAADAAANLPPLDECADASHLALEEEGETAAEREAGQPLRSGLETARALVLAGQAQQAREALGPIVEKARAAKSPAALAEALFLLGRAASQTHDEKAARPALVEALQLALETKYDALAADAAASLVYAAAEDPAASALVVPVARGVVARAGAPAMADSLLHHGIGAAAYGAGHYTEAAREFARAAQIAEVRLGPEHPRTLNSLIAEAEALSMTGDTARALPLAQRVLAAQEHTLGAENSRLVPTLLTVADQLLGGDHPEQARPLLERAKAMCRRDFGPESSTEDAVDGRLAKLEAAEGHSAAARALLEHALADRLRRANGVEGPSTSGLRVALARVLMQQGALAAASDQAQRAYRAIEHLEPESPDLADPLTVVGELAIARGDAAAARTALERALQLRVQGNAPPLEDARTRFALARALGRTPRGRELATQARTLIPGRPLAAEIDRWLQAQK